MLALLLAALVVFAYVTRPQPAGPEPQFLPCPRQDTVSIRIQSPERVVELERPTSRDPWRITQPSQAPADPDGVQTLTGSIATIRVLNTLERPEAPATYGLDRPRQVLTCRVTNGTSYNLSVGNQSFDGSGYYAQKSGDGRVYVVSSVSIDAFGRALAGPPVKPSPSPSR